MNERTGFSLPAVTIFLGSFLIFGVQPMLGRTLLPAFGGTAAVWVVCLASFQLLLLVGYFYAHCASGGRKEEVGGRSWKKAHILLLALAVVWVVGFAVGRPWLMAHIGGGAYPALEVLLCVLAFVGLPYVLLSANSTLIQAWLAREGSGFRVSSSANTATEDKQGSGVRESEVSRETENQTIKTAESDSCGSCHSDAKEHGENRGNIRLQLPLLMLSFPLLVEHYYEIFDYRILE